jgi:hypothetical protein
MLLCLLRLLIIGLPGRGSWGAPLREHLELL